jgi:hypothetical protein
LLFLLLSKTRGSASIPVVFRLLSLFPGTTIVFAVHFFEAMACFKLLCAVQTVAAASVFFVVYDAR